MSGGRNLAVAFVLQPGDEGASSGLHDKLYCDEMDWVKYWLGPC